ncbi:DUF551 domain-containing protein [Leclercia sp. W17]|uniref:DUF551 domain-containing protein n=1 Tax=Leclercia sp. W17 TaxID=2282309 RepID=UPI000DF27C70|nr:DUF551 domain-containing protein [Leclercia sp. W17]AXF66100.1 DUF551 domain-containing protein [Leclercia sp. W17]
MEWIKCSEEMPPPEEAVLILRNGDVYLGIRQWEYPSHEDAFDAFLYWDDFHNDGQGWEDDEVTHWLPIPDNPTE